MHTPYPHETNGLINPALYQERYGDAPTVDWTTKGLRVTRLRLLTDPGLPFFDVSYCHGEVNGKPVDVRLPFSQLPRRGWRKMVVELAKQEGIYAKGMGILDNTSLLF